MPGVVLLYLEFASPPLLMLDRVRPCTRVYPQSPFFQNRQPNRFIHLLHSTALIHLSRELTAVVNNKKKSHDDALTNETTTKQAEHSRTHTRVLYLCASSLFLLLFAVNLSFIIFFSLFTIFLCFVLLIGPLVAFVLFFLLGFSIRALIYYTNSDTKRNVKNFARCA